MGWTSTFVDKHEEAIEARLSITITVVLTLVQSTTARPSVIADVNKTTFTFFKYRLYNCEIIFCV